VTSFSIIPLRLFSFIGILVSLGALLYGMIILVSAMLGHPMPTGFASLAVGIFFLGGIQLIGIGVMGEYIGHIFDETRRRPVYLVRETSLAAGPTTPPAPP
jgi:Na+/H+ antiporter NhaC